MVRVAVNEDSIIKMLIDLSAMVGLDGVPLHFQLFPKLWLDIYSNRNIERTTLNSAISLLVDSHGFLEYVDAVLLDERLSLNNQYVFQFLYVFFPKVADQVLTDQVKSLIHSLCKNLQSVAADYDLTKPGLVKHLNGDLRALVLVQGGVGELNTAQLGEAVAVLKQRLVEQLARLGDTQTGETEGSSDDTERGAGRPSIEERSPERAGSSGGGAGSSSGAGRRGGPARLRDACLALDRSLDMLLAELTAKTSQDQEEAEGNQEGGTKEEKAEVETEKKEGEVKEEEREGVSEGPQAGSSSG